MEYILRSLADCYQSVSLSLLLSGVPLPALKPAEEFAVNHRRFKAIKQLGEGGYAIVYLVKEVPTPEQPLVEPMPYALKKINACSDDRLDDARREIEALQDLSHPNVLRLLDSCVAVPPGAAAPGPDQLVADRYAYLLFPAYQDGSLADELERRAAAGQKLSTAEVLHIFSQVCQGVQHMHSRGYAHRDIKPHNILIRRAGSGSKDTENSTTLQEDPEAGGAQQGYEVVIMDLGSARAKRLEVGNRVEALALQEDAEANCTATYRAPELLDVPSYCVIDERVDVWSLGCTLYHAMYGASPFQAAMDQTGASLALAVMNNKLIWPKDPSQRYPQELHDLVAWCLTSDADKRPYVAAVLDRLKALQGKKLADPAGAAGPGAPPLAAAARL